jgi:hypothetical protein
LSWRIMDSRTSVIITRYESVQLWSLSLSLCQNERTTAETSYKTREIIHAVGRSLLIINKSGHADGVRCLPQTWQKVVHIGGWLYWRNVSGYTSGNKAISELQRHCQ